MSALSRTQSSPLSRVHVSSEFDGVYLECLDHPRWSQGLESLDIVCVIQTAATHIREAHRVHVGNCHCRDRVIDGRCVPALGLITLEMLR